ncbi:hypothetical protein GOP47_0013389 [Adiantum capillus-veneris]|uniref:RWP-RK domain-containing protein n=1 Tax=Adiantum capillus-veneris TaxID=13818 RepID=A0A9D4ZD52_ADICA|nr:hypothetical protein GOP47_0013389 [Adiantum capillus-veneris]
MAGAGGERERDYNAWWEQEGERAGLQCLAVAVRELWDARHDLATLLAAGRSPRTSVWSKGQVQAYSAPISFSEGEIVAKMELSTPHPDQPLLLGLAVFQNLHKLEYVRSFHMYKKGEHLHTIQQEFLSKGGAFTEIGPPTHLACICDGGAAAHAKDYMDLVTAKQEKEGWKCLLDFCKTPPRNPHSPLTAPDMLVANAWSSANALFINANNAHESCSVNWEHPQCIFPSVYACLKEHESSERAANKHTPEESTDITTQRLQLDLWQQWGSDLELASPRLSRTFELPLLRNLRSDVNMGVYGATSSPSSSSSLSSNNLDSLPWAQTHIMAQSPKMSDVLTGTPSNEEVMSLNVIGVACTFISPNPSFETLLGESSPDCNILTNVLPLDLNQMAVVNAVNPHDSKMNGYCDHSFDCGMSQPMSSTSNTYSSSDERSLEAENSDILDQLKELDAASIRKAKLTAKLHKFNSPRAGSGRLSKLTKDELTHYFNMPITQASKELKVGLTVLKKRCRIFGIPRWPHRKMKSINGLIRNIQDLVKGDGAEESGKDANQVQVAVEELEKQKKEMQECPGIQLPERTKRLRQACFKASYRKRRQALTDPSADHHDNALGSNSSSSFYYPHRE